MQPNCYVLFQRNNFTGGTASFQYVQCECNIHYVWIPFIHTAVGPTKRPPSVLCMTISWCLSLPNFRVYLECEGKNFYVNPFFYSSLLRNVKFYFKVPYFLKFRSICRLAEMASSLHLRYEGSSSVVITPSIWIFCSLAPIHICIRNLHAVVLSGS